MKLAIGCLAAASLSACAIQPARQQLPRAPTPLQTMISTCDFSARPDLQALDGKFPLSLNQIQQPGLALLATERRPTADEQAALALYDRLHRSCVTAQANWLSAATFEMMPEAMALQARMLAAEQSHLTALYQGTETFAEFTRADNSLHIGFQNDFNRMAQNAYAKTLQQIRSSEPVQTDCRAYDDGSVRCTTQQ